MKCAKMLRRLMLPALAAMTAAALSACGQQPEKKADPQAFIKEEGVRLTEKMGKLAASDEYLKVIGIPGTLEDQAKAIGIQDYSVPEAVYTLNITDITANRLLGQGQEPEELSPEIAEEIHWRLNAAFYANLINGAQGAETIATVTVLTCRQDYPEPAQWPGDTLLILQYGGGYSSLVSFMTSGEGIIEANASFVMTGEEDVVEQLCAFLSMEPSMFKKME